MKSKTFSPAYSFKNTGMKLLKGAGFAALAGIAAYLVNDVPNLDFGAFQSIVVAAAMFVANAIKEFIQERK